MHHSDIIPVSPNVIPTEAAAPPRLPISVRRFVALTALAAVTATSGAVTAAEMIETKDPNPISAAKNAGQRVLNNLELTDCPPIPADATIIQIRQEVNNPAIQNFNEAKATARAQGMEFAEGPRPYAEMHDAKTPQEATEVVSGYMEQNYGFELELDMPADKQAGIDRERYNQALVGMISYTSLLPNQLIQAPDIPKVVITDLYDQTKREVDGKTLGNSGQFNPETRVVTLDINHVGDAVAFVHEALGHGVQRTVCGRAESRDDTRLSSQNPPGFSYTNSDASVLETAVEDVTATGYSKKTVGEDYAELAETFITGQNADYLQSVTDTPADNKLAIVLHDYDELVPGSSAYLNTARPWLRDMQRTNPQPVYTAPAA